MTAVGKIVTGHQVRCRVGGFSKVAVGGRFLTCDARPRGLPPGLTDEQAITAACHRLANDLARIQGGDKC